MQHTITRPGTGAARAVLASRLLMAFLAIMLLPASAAGAPLRNPQLESMQVEIWPEFDRQAALVILRGTLAADAKLPADVRLRIGAATGGPSAMAYSATAGGNLLNLEYERVDAKDFITLRFKVQERFFHVEFYDPLAIGVPERSYTYIWPGDMSVKRLSLVVQEPAAASNFSAQPDLGSTTTGQDGLRYHSADLGARAAGTTLPIKVSYTKNDARTSAEILQAKTPAPIPAPAQAPAPSAGSGDEVTKGVLVFILSVSLLIGIGMAVLWWRGRPKTSNARASGAGACTKCGTPRDADDRFCSNCGAKLK